MTNTRTENYQDIWDSEDDICAFCAAPVSDEANNCPLCSRSLIRRHYRYKVSAILHLFWVFLFTLSMLMIFQALFQWKVVQNTASTVWHFLLAAVLLILVIGVYFRIFWAHITSIIVLILGTVLSIVDFLVRFDPGNLGMESGDPIFRGITIDFMERLAALLNILQLTVALIALFYAIFRVGPEFDRVKERLIARTKKGLHTAADYHMAARRLAGDGMWASAVLHWQRAAAIEPSRIAFHNYLARAYLRLGFYDRGLDILQSALERPMQPDTKQELSRLANWTKQQIGRQNQS